MKLRLPAAFLLGLLVCGCASLGGAPATGAGGGQGVGDPMPALVVHDLLGKRDIDLTALRGKVVLLDLWASWCEPCRTELPMLDDIAGRVGRKGVEIVAVSIDAERASALDFLKRRPHWAITLGHDPAGAVPERLQPATMPTSYIVDRKGILRAVNVGFRREDAAKLEARLLELADAN
jgi:cytochrome c biogenesis protein CcmG/thiol:disulfide interchange protein DsbE